MCDANISASIGPIAEAHAPTHTYNSKKHLRRLHTNILKLVQQKDNASPGTPTASNTKTFEYWKEVCYNNSNIVFW